MRGLRCLLTLSHRFGPTTTAEGGYPWMTAIMRECKDCGFLDAREIPGRFKPARPSPAAVVEDMLGDLDE